MPASPEVVHFLKHFDCDSRRNISVTREWTGSTSLQWLLSMLK